MTILPTTFVVQVDQSVRVWLCLRTRTSVLKDLWPRYLACWFILTLCRSGSKVKITGQSSWSHDENIPFLAMDACHDVTYLSSSLCYSGRCDLEWGLSSSYYYYHYHFIVYFSHLLIVLSVARPGHHTSPIYHDEAIERAADGARTGSYIFTDVDGPTTNIDGEHTGGEWAPSERDWAPRRGTVASSSSRLRSTWLGKRLAASPAIYERRPRGFIYLVIAVTRAFSPAAAAMLISPFHTHARRWSRII